YRHHERRGHRVGDVHAHEGLRHALRDGDGSDPRSRLGRLHADVVLRRGLRRRDGRRERPHRVGQGHRLQVGLRLWRGEGDGHPPLVSCARMAAPVRIGTCSWADDALMKHWYPPGTPAQARLPWYAEHYSTVEVDSTYYRVPTEQMVRGWAERTPPGFVMHVKAFGLMTRHPVKLQQVPPDLREGLPVDDRGRVDRPPRELRGLVFDAFLDALEPLRAAGKLGGILFQLPPYVTWKPSSLAYLEWANDRLRGLRMLVEPRHRSWYEEDARAELLRWLEERGLSWVVVDAPKVD